MKAHTEFDTLWKGENAVMSRTDAYNWLQKEMRITKGKEAHIARFDVKQCRRLIAIVTLKRTSK